MAEVGKATGAEMVACDICLKEIPASEARSDEASEYVRYFCGLECYAKWKEQEKNQGR